ncbi:MAG: hypothetical protein VX255_00145, partial [Candidatus Latescibacterota bacterium]|nr:hypothetical protein [Candidatus Latescibacterota bacterium]
MRTRFGLIALLLSTALPAVISLSATEAGAIVNIQSLGASARSSALGNAYVAVADNGDAVFANPAGLA